MYMYPAFFEAWCTVAANTVVTAATKFAALLGKQGHMID